MSSQQIENEIQAKGLTAPRVTPAEIQAEIVGCFFFTAKDAVKVTEPDDFRYFSAEPQLKLLTFCVLVLANGFTVTGESACASPENFDAELGQKIARQNAEAKIWPLLGFRLRDKLAAGKVDGVDGDARDPIGKLDEWGSHTIEGEPDRFFTEDGYDRATTDQQRANIRTQLGLDESGEHQPAGPGPVGWATGQLVNTFSYPLFRNGGSDGMGGVKWVQADGFNEPGRSPTYLFQRTRVRARGIDAIRAALASGRPTTRG